MSTTQLTPAQSTHGSPCTVDHVAFHPAPVVAVYKSVSALRCAGSRVIATLLVGDGEGVTLALPVRVAVLVALVVADTVIVVLRLGDVVVVPVAVLDPLAVGVRVLVTELVAPGVLLLLPDKLGDGVGVSVAD